VPDKDSKRSMAAGAAETSPLLVGMVGISIPVALLATAAVSGSVIVLVLAVLAMLAVGGATLAFVLLLASDESGHAEGSETSHE
jgi:hypothetical protein